MDKDRKRRNIISALISISLHMALLVVLFFSVMKAPLPKEPAIDAQKTEITFGGEYVQLGDIPEPNLNDDAASNAADNDAASDGADDVNEGNPAEGESVVASKHESPMVAEAKPRGPSEAELREQERIRREEERRRQEQQRISNRTSGAFNNAGNAAGSSGSNNGNASTGALAGQPGHNLGANYHLTAPQLKCKKSGTINISVVVRSDGSISSAKYIGGKGEAAGDASIQSYFVNETKKLKFKVSGNVPAEKRGTITWVIK